MKTAISYIRFSTPDQIKGASLSRQSEGAIALCQSKGWSLMDKSYRDLGISAFGGANGSKGELGVFIRACEDGEIPIGTVLIVENLDRLSRASVPDAFMQFVRILNLGIEVYTLFDNQHYTKERISTDTASILMSILLMVRAHEESQTKSIRIKDAYRRKKATKKIWASRYPSWLSLNGDTFVIKEDEADVIRKIFKLYLSGYGSTMIAKYMNEHHPRVPLTNSSASRWSPSLINLWLRHYSVIGTLVPNDETQPWTIDYYPAIVSKDDFYLVQNKLSGPRNVKQENVGNLMTLHCVCGSSIKIMGAVTERRDGRYLRCESSISGTCKSATIRYGVFERDAMAMVNNAEIGDDLPVVDKSVRQSELNDINTQIGNLSSAIAMLPDPNQIPMLVERLAKLQLDANRITGEIQTFVPKSSMSKKFQRFRDAYKLWLTDEFKNEYRLALRTSWLDLVERIEIGLDFVKMGERVGRIYHVKGDFKGSNRVLVGFVEMEAIRSYTKSKI
jgi:DNA invertase Pin-like site-specific DNA recombinase